MFPEARVMEVLALKEQDFMGGLIPNGIGLVNVFTSMFAHSGFAHLMGNMFFVSPFAIYLENRIGALKFLCYWIISGIGAVGLFVVIPHLMPWGGLMGASGCCSGIMAAACVLDNEDFFVRFLGLIAFLFIFTAQVYSAFIGLIDAGNNVAYAAHVGGMVTGLLVMHYIKPTKKALVK